MTTENIGPAMGETDLDRLLAENRGWLKEVMGMEAPDNWQAVLAAHARRHRIMEWLLAEAREWAERWREGWEMRACYDYHLPWERNPHA